MTIKRLNPQQTIIVLHQCELFQIQHGPLFGAPKRAKAPPGSLELE
jgi:hypothetical protein